MESPRQLLELLCQMLPGGSLLENFWSLVSQTMQLPIELQLAVIHYSEIVSVSMGVLGSELSIDFTIVIMLLVTEYKVS